MEQLNSKSIMPEQFEREAKCEEHGVFMETGVKYPIMKSTKWMGCPQCQEIKDRELKQKEAEEKRLLEMRKFEEMIGRTGLPRRFIGKTFDTFKAQTPEQSRAFNIAYEYASEFESHKREGTGLIFLGKPGTGKSHLVAAIIQNILPDRIGVYVTVSDLIRAVRGAWRKDSEYSETEVLNHFIYADLLAMDEVGKQYGTDGEQQIIFDVLDGRYREMKPTILMGNVLGEELSVYLGERVADRLRETNTAISFNWDSYRKRAA